jgi:hypothetical protein
VQTPQTTVAVSADPPLIGSAGSVTLQAIAASCTNGTCPTVYRTDRNTVVVQGYVMAAETAGIDVPNGELLVEIPLDLLHTAARSAS